MRNSVKASLLLLCLSLCTGAAILANLTVDRNSNLDLNHAQAGEMAPVDSYLYAASDASLKLSLNEIEVIIRRDPSSKAQHGRMEFGSVKVEHGAVLAEVMFLEVDGRMQAYLYKLRHDQNLWKVAGAQRLWFVPRSRFLRGIRA